MDKISQILRHLPYDHPFRFVDAIDEINEMGIRGRYTIKEDEYFFQGHFRNQPVVPGVIITEIMAQIGLVSFGIGLLLDLPKDKIPPGRVMPVFSNYSMEFVTAVGPGAELIVESKKVFFRLGKLTCKVKCTTKDGQVVARGELGGVLFDPKNPGIKPQGEIQVN